MREEDGDEAMTGVGTGASSSVRFKNVLDFNSGISVDLSDPLCPKFMIDDQERECLCKPFAKSLLVKLLGGSLSLYFLESNLNQIWARKGVIKLGDLENDVFVVSFQEWEDYERALTGGPWVISDKYLSVMRWRPGFNPRKEKIDKIAAWVRFPEIEVELFDKKIMYNLSNSIGKVLKLDVHTASRGRNKFARVCIELDLTKPLVAHYMVDGVLKQASGPWKVVQRLRRQRKDRPMNEDIKIASRYAVLNTGEEPGQGDIVVGRGVAMEENIGRRFIKRRDRGLRKPVSIVNENGPHTEATIVPIGSQQRSLQGERSKREGRMGPNKGKLTVPVPEYKGERNGQVMLHDTSVSDCSKKKVGFSRGCRTILWR
ncbi:hypothetical protein K1719_033314 [Acacia pycnantha]|nr:hypothetical protein K1719_033314 [Acacia pycnantha]